MPEYWPFSLHFTWILKNSVVMVVVHSFIHCYNNNYFFSLWWKFMIGISDILNKYKHKQSSSSSVNYYIWIEREREKKKCCFSSRNKYYAYNTIVSFRFGCSFFSSFWNRHTVGWLGPRSIERAIIIIITIHTLHSFIHCPSTILIKISVFLSFI